MRNIVLLIVLTTVFYACVPSGNEAFMPVTSGTSPNSDPDGIDFVGEYTYKQTLPEGAIETGHLIVKKKKSLYYLQWTRDDGPSYFGLGMRTGNLLSVCYSYGVFDKGERGITVFTLSAEPEISGKWAAIGDPEGEIYTDTWTRK